MRIESNRVCPLAGKVGGIDRRPHGPAKKTWMPHRFHGMGFLWRLALCLVVSEPRQAFGTNEIAKPASHSIIPVKITHRLGKGVTLKTRDNALKVNLKPWLQADYVAFNEDITQASDQLELRRARIGITLELLDRWRARADYDFTGEELDIRGVQDLYLRYSGSRGYYLTLGNQKEPLGLEWQISSRNLTFLERALPIALVPPYHLGVTAGTHGRNWSAMAGVFGDRLQDGIDADNGYGASGRFTLALRPGKSFRLHLGMSGGYRKRGERTRNLRFSSGPESGIEDVRFVNTRSIRHVTDYQTFGTEFAAWRGPFAVQAEHLRSFVNRNHGRDDLQFDGWYVYASWILTGETRGYRSSSGSFGSVKPHRPFDFHGGWGAWELAARYSELNLNDRGIHGGHENNITLGVNLYLNSYARVMANYVFIQTETPASGRRQARSEEPSLFQTRVQIEF
jgi:phosphate-selective porin OprO/OprP